MGAIWLVVHFITVCAKTSLSKLHSASVLKLDCALNTAAPVHVRSCSVQVATHLIDRAKLRTARL
jgi:hypothetical protein